MRQVRAGVLVGVRPMGVTENGRKKKVYLGLFDTDVSAHAAYVQAKRERHPGNTL